VPALGTWPWRERVGRGEAFARACHELRGSITAVRLGLELDAAAARTSSSRLRALRLELEKASLALDDLQGVGIESRAPAPVLSESVDLPLLLADAVELWRSAAARRGVQLRLRWSGPAVKILADRLRLAQATGNLIANALEHGEGDVEVRAQADAAGARIEVIDGGGGLPAPVAQLSRRARRGRGPRGRGLAITTAIAAAHGGRLGVRPSDRGARLVLELPRSGRSGPSPLPGARR
jgi:signal transduction histidine kinase